MGFRLVPKSVTLNDLERRNGRLVCAIVEFGSFGAVLRTRSSATAKNTARQSCIVGVLYDFIGRQTTDQQLINHLYENGHETYRIPRNNAK